MTSSTQELAREITRLRRKVEGRKPQLIHSTIEGGAVPVRDLEGQLTALVGQQYDGTFGAVTVAGPTPPTPSAASVEVVPGLGLRITWDGTFLDGPSVVAPMDWLRCEVSISSDPVFTGGLLMGPFDTSIESPRGGTVDRMVDYDVDFYVRLVARSSSGKPSPASPVVGPFRVPRLTAEDLDVDFDALGGTTVFYGDVEPVTEYIGDLWLKEPENITHRWMGPPDGWQPVRDQGITQAILDAKAANDKAVQAGIDALAAQTSAASKTATFRQDSPPATTGRTVGDEWYETDQGNRLHIWSGSAWTLTQHGAGAISATARQLGAITTYRQTSAPTTGMVVGDFWQDSDDGNKLYRYEGATPTWVAVQDAAIQTAITNAATAQATADGKMRIFPQASAPAGLTADDVGDLWIDTDDSNVSYTWNGAAWTKRQVGNGAIQPNSLIARDVVATGTVTAALLEAVLILATLIILGDQTGDHTRISSAGLIAYASDPIDGVPDEVARFGRNAGGRDPATGKATWNVDNSGAAQYRTVSTVEDPRFMGKPLIGQLLKERPEGFNFVSKNIMALGAPVSVETGLYEMAFVAKPGRAYEIKTSHVNIQQSVSGGRYVMMLHLTTDGTRPTHSSPVAVWQSGSASAFQDAPWESASVQLNALHINNTSSDQFVQMLLCMAPQGGGSVNLYRVNNSGFFMWVTEVGPAYGQSQGVGMVNNMSDNTAAPVATAAPRERTVDFIANWTRTWREDGGIQGDGYAEQGYYAGKGNTRSMIGFPDMTGTLAGAEIRRIELYLKNSHWYDGDGGTAVIRTHGWGSLPNSFSQNAFPLGMDVPGWPRYQDWWMFAPLDWGTGLINGSIRGITLGPAPSNSTDYYGRFEGSGSPFNKPTIRVTYVK